MSFGPRSAEAVALGVEVLDLAGVDVDALDPAADVVGGLGPGTVMPSTLGPLEAAVVADVDLAVGPMAAPFGPPPVSATRVIVAVGRDPRQRAALDLDDHDAAVVHGDRALREAESVAHQTKICHLYPLGAQVGCDSHTSARCVSVSRQPWLASTMQNWLPSGSVSTTKSGSGG